MLPLCTFILPGYHQAHRIENRPWHGSRWTLLVDTEQLLVRNKETAVNSKEKQCAETRLSTCALQHWFPDRESISITWGMCYTDGCTLNMHLSTLPASNSVNPRWYLKRHGNSSDADVLRPATTFWEQLYCLHLQKKSVLREKCVSNIELEKL